MSPWKPLARGLARRLAAHSLGPRVAAFLLKEHRAAARARLRPAGTFVDASGHAHQLLDGLRDQVVPRWRRNLEPVSPAPASREQREGALNHARVSLTAVRDHLALHGFEFRGKRVLEVGCGQGAFSYALASLGAEAVVGLEYAPYYGGEESPRVAKLREDWAGTGEVAGAFFGQPEVAERVSFQLGDVRAPGPELARESFDLVLSWEVLEHLSDPPAAFRALAGLLVPGGLAFHEYNPFFSRAGGHSACTLDMDWGHAQLDEADLARYLSELRPEEAEEALRFFREDLNSMTLADLREATREAGLELVELLPWTRREDLELLDAGILERVRRHHPRVGPVDLASPFVWVLQRRPG